MDDVLVVVRLALAAVFAVAAAAKWTDRSGTRDAARALGVPTPLARVVPVGLPPVELALAAALFPVTTAPFAAGGIAALLIVFIALIAVNLQRGRKPSCHCFGALDSEPIGTMTIIRNVVILAAAVFVAGAGVRRSADIFAGGPFVDVAVFAGLVGAAFAFGRVAERVAPAPAAAAAEKDARSTGPTIGDRAPSLALRDLDNSPVTLQSLSRDGLPVLLVLGDLGCGSCRTMLPLIREWQTEHRDLFTPAFVVAASVDEARRQADADPIDHFLLRTDGPVLAGFGSIRTPSAVLVDRDGTIAHAPAIGPDAIRALVSQLAGFRATSFAAPRRTREALGGMVLDAGADAPRFRLVTEAGTVVSERDVPSPSVFVVLDADSQPCRDLVEEIAASNALAQRAVFVTTDDHTVAMGAGAMVLGDRLGLLPTVFGVTAVPSAVTVADGIVTSSIVAGADAVIELLAREAVEPIEPDALTTDFVPRPSDRVMAVGVNGKTVVVDGDDRRYHVLEGTAGIIWPLLDGTATVEEIAVELSDAFGAPPDVVRADVLEFARQLASAGVLDGVRPEPAEHAEP